MSKDQGFRYDLMLGRALRGIARQALQQVARNDSALPGSHYFSLTFVTNHPQAELPQNLRERYPLEMTIILQHQFADLAVQDDNFAVTLFFQGRPARLVVPFDSVIRFADPSVGFTIQMPPDGIPISSTTKQQSPGSSSSQQVTNAGEKVISLDQFRREND